MHGVAAFAFGLIHALAARYDAGEPLPVHDSWRIDENRWAAMRDGVDGTLADLETRRARADARAAAARADALTLHPATEALIEANGAIRTRRGRAGRRRRVPRRSVVPLSSTSRTSRSRAATPPAAAGGLKRAGRSCR